MRWLLGGCVVILALCWTVPAGAQGEPGGLIPETTAARHGLTRAWFAQAEVNSSVSKLRTLTFYAGTIFVTSDHALVQAFDAETGRILWKETVGNVKYPTSGVGANGTVAAVTNGTSLYLYETATGKFLDKRPIGGVPSATPGVGPDDVYLPLSRELVEVDKIKLETHLPPKLYSAIGKTFNPPLIGYESAMWATESGRVYAVSLEGGGQRFQAEAFGGVTAPMTYRAPYVFVGSLGGYVYALHENNGRTLWRFTASDPIRLPPVVIQDAVYVVPESGGIFRVNAGSGAEEWHTPSIRHFLAASKTRVYGTDEADRLTVLDAATGARIDVLPISGYSLKLINTTNDRIYLASENGLVQCLHEAELKEPLNYAPPKPAKAPEKGAGKPKKGEGDAPPAGPGKADKEPLPGPAKPAAPVEDPFK